MTQKVVERKGLRLSRINEVLEEIDIYLGVVVEGCLLVEF